MSKKNNCYQLKIQLQYIRPSIYRAILINSGTTFFELHGHIQDAFGLENGHLWEFQHGNKKDPDRIALSLLEDALGFDEEPDFEAESTTIEDILKAEKEKLVYWYDFGDDWKFDITVQKILPVSELDSKIKMPHLLKAQGGMLMEDMGGAYFWGDIIGLYEHLKLGKKLSKEEKENCQNIFWTVLGEDEEWEDYESCYLEVLDELSDIDWKKFKFRR
jgi:hypothetical protein